jgi:hypothetical protein
MSVKIVVFWEVTPYSLVDRYQHFVGQLLKADTLRFSVTLVTVYQTIRCHLSEDRDPNLDDHEDTRSRKVSQKCYCWFETYSMNYTTRTVSA